MASLCEDKMDDLQYIFGIEGKLIFRTEGKLIFGRDKNSWYSEKGSQLHVSSPHKSFPAQKEVNFSLLRMNHRTLEVIIQETKNLEENSLKMMEKPV